MTMSREAFDQVVNHYKTLLIMDDDPADALDFVASLIDAEIDALRERCPYATRTISQLEDAHYIVYSLCSDASNNIYNEE